MSSGQKNTQDEQYVRKSAQNSYRFFLSIGEKVHKSRQAFYVNK